MAHKPAEEEKLDPIQDEENIKKRNQKIAIGFIIAIILIIVGLLIWPLINKGTLVFNTSNIGGSLIYCQVGPLQENELSPHNGGCPESFDQNTININASPTKITLPAGEYYLFFSQDKFSSVESSAIIKFGQGTQISIDLLPLVSKYIDDYTAAISTNPATPYLIKYIAGYSDQINQTGYFEKFIIADINQPDTAIMELTGFEDIFNLNWSPDNIKFFMTATSPGDTTKTEKKYLVNITDKTVIESNLNYSNIAWSGNSQKVYYVYYDIQKDPNFIFPSSNEGQQGALVPLIKGPNHNALTLANPDGSDWQTIIKLDDTIFNDPKIIPSPDGKDILLIPKNQLAYRYSFASNEIKRYSELDNIYNASWSPDSQLLLLETYYQNKPALYITNPANEKYIWTDTRSFIYKTTWKDNRTLFMTAPNYIPGPDDIPYNSIDIVKKIDFELSPNGEIKYEVSPIIASSPTINNALNLLYNQKQNTLYLLDYENYLNQLPLGQ